MNQCDEHCSDLTYEEHQKRHRIENLAKHHGFNSVYEWAAYEKAKQEQGWEQQLFNEEVLLWGYKAATKLKKERELQK